VTAVPGIPVRIVARDNLGRVVDGIELALTGVRDWRSFWGALDRPWHRSRAEMFRSLGRSTGTPWPLYQQTAEREVYQWAKVGILGEDWYHLRPLHWMRGRERLKPSMVSRRHPDNVWAPRRLSLDLGTRAPGADNHDRGYGRAPRWAGGHAIPRRPLLTLGVRFVMDVRDELKAKAVEVAKTIKRPVVGTR